MSRKFSIAELEKARKNPVDFAKLLKAGESSGGGFGYPKSMRWLNAICKYHDSNNISDAINSIEDGLSSRKDTTKNRRELETLIEALGNYENEIQRRRLSLIKSREQVDLTLNSQLRLKGLIPIILMKPTNGFSAFFVSQENLNWQSELKYPIMQNYVANQIFSTDCDEVDIGYINFYTGEFHETCFSSSEIDDAKKELESIGKIISLNL